MISECSSLQYFLIGCPRGDDRLFLWQHQLCCMREAVSGDVTATQGALYEVLRVNAGATTTKFLESLPFSPKAIEVVSPGMNTTIQARP